MRRRMMIIDKGRVLRIVRLALPVIGWGSVDNPLRLDRQINCLLLLRFGLAAVYKNSSRPMEGSISVSQSASQPFLPPLLATIKSIFPLLKGTRFDLGRAPRGLAG